MRTLKKTLCLVLCLAMMAGLCAMGASAAFTDADEITYKEAVDVLTAIGIINGVGDGTKFAPKDTLNRASACKIISYVLGAGDIKGTGRFTDCVGHWAEGYIAYCAAEGIVNGVSETEFNPDGTLTGYAFAKMLLGAVGYDADHEGMTGKDWEIGVAKLMKTTGLSKVIKGFNGTVAITREEACALALAAMKMPTKNFEAGTKIEGTGLSVTTGGKYGADGASLLADVNGYNVTVSATGSDKYGRPATTYTRAKTASQTRVALTFAATAVDTYTEGFTARALTTLKADNANYFAPTTKILVNGQDQTVAIANGGDAVANLAARAYVGTVIEFYDADKTDSYTVDTIVVVQAYLAKVSNVVSTYATKTSNHIDLVVDNPWGSATTVQFYDNTSAVDSTYDKLVAKYVKNDYVLTYWTGAAVAGANFIEAAKADSLTGHVTATTITVSGGFNGSLAIDGATKKLASGYAEHTGAQTTVVASSKNEYNFYLDANGYVIGIVAVSEAAATYHYGIVVDYAKADGTPASNMTGEAAKDAFEKVQVYTSEGAVVIYDTAFTSSSTTMAITKAIAPADWYNAGHPDSTQFDGKLIAYTLNDAGKISKIEEAGATGTLTTHATKTAAFKTNGTTYATANTVVFVLKSGVANYTAAGAKTELAVYTGYASVPATTYGAGQAFESTTKMAAGAVSATIGALPSSTTTTQYAVLTSATPTVTESKTEGKYDWTYKAIVDGVEKDIVWTMADSTTAPVDAVSAALAKNALYTVTFDTKTGAVATFTKQSTATDVTVSASQASFYVTSTPAEKYVDSKTVYYKVDVAADGTTVNGFALADALDAAPTAADTFVLHEWFATTGTSAPTGVTYVFFYTVY